jgi:hypothetical protein
VNEEELFELKDQTQIEETDLRCYLEIKEALSKAQMSSEAKKKSVKFNVAPDSTEPLSLSKYINCFEFISSSNTVKPSASETYTDSLSSNNNLMNSLNDYSQQRHYQLKASINSLDKQMLSTFLFASLLRTKRLFDSTLFATFLKTIPLRKIQLFVNFLKFYHTKKNIRTWFNFSFKKDLMVNAWLNNQFRNISSLYSVAYILSGCAYYIKNKSKIFEENQSLIADSQSIVSFQSSKSKMSSVLTIQDDAQTIKDEDSDKDDEQEEDEDEDENEDFDHDFGNTFVVEYLPKFQSICESSSSLTESLLLDWVVKSILVQVIL